VETHEWTNKTFESFQAQLTARLKGVAGMMPGVSSEPAPPGWRGVKALYFVTLLTMATSTIRVVFSQPQYTPMINHIGNALVDWESSNGLKNAFSAGYYEALRDLEKAHESMARGNGITCVSAENLLMHGGFVGKGFNYDSPINHMIFMDCEMLLLDFMPPYWKRLAETHRLSV
jgi:hypothetical protein